MRSHNRRIFSILVISFLFTACTTVTPTQSWPKRPTATLHAPEEAGKGEFFDPYSGIRMSFPSSWELEDGDEYSLGDFYSADGAIFMTLYDDSEYFGDIQETTRENFYYGTEGLTDIQVLSEEPFTFDTGETGWMVTGLATLDDGTELELSVTTLQSNAVVAVLFSGGLTEDYRDRLDEVYEVIRTMRVEEAATNGIPRSQALVLSGWESTNPRDYDPATMTSGDNHLIFSSLVALDPQMNLQPDLAAYWDVSGDGTVYTFHIRQNARFHNGRPVTAQDVIYSWDRAADPATESNTVLTYLGDIVGVKERHEGTASEISGLKTLDDKTLQVTIDAGKPYFLYKLAYATAYIVDKENIALGAEWYRTPNGSGPYRLARWDSFELMIYERNEDYYLEPPNIPFVVVKLFIGEDLRSYETGAIDIAWPSLYDLDRVLYPNEPLNRELVSEVSLCTDYVNFDTTKAPFDDVKVRQAFSMAFDRQKYIDVVLLGKALPAEGVYPPALPGYDINLEGLPYNPERARELLAESKYGGAGNLPEIVYTTSGYGSDSDLQASALAQMWQQNLGVEITIENLAPDLYYDEIIAGHHGQMMSNGWCADYPDPQNFVDVLFHSGAEWNESNYNNPELDRLLEEAWVEKDISKRIAMYQEAERIIINDAPVLFLDHSIDYVLVKPRVKGYVLTPITMALERYLRLEGE